VTTWGKQKIHDRLETGDLRSGNRRGQETRAEPETAPSIGSTREATAALTLTLAQGARESRWGWEIVQQGTRDWQLPRAIGNIRGNFQSRGGRDGTARLDKRSARLDGPCSSLRKLERRENIGRFLGDFQFSQVRAALRKLAAV
jgi:hypothetical protein